LLAVVAVVEEQPVAEAVVLVVLLFLQV